MRNAGFTPDCGCGPVIGEIRNGFKYPFGTVTTEQLRQVLTDVNNELDRLGNYCNSLNEKESVNEANIKNNKENIADTRAAVSRMQESISQTRENVLALMTSIDKVNAKAETNASAITEIKEKTDAIVADVNNITGAVTKLTNDLNAAKIDITATTDALSERIAALEGGDEMIVINSISATPRTAELGSVVNVTINWNLSRPATRADINGIDITNQTMYTAADVSRSTEYKLSVYDEKDRKVTASAKIDFQNHIFWGTSADTTITETLVELLNNNVISDAKARTISVSPNDEYVYYAYPKRLGTATFRLGMLVGGFTDPATIRITNPTGYAEDYLVYRSTQKFTYASVDFTIS